MVVLLLFLYGLTFIGFDVSATLQIQIGDWLQNGII